LKNTRTDKELCHQKLLIPGDCILSILDSFNCWKLYSFDFLGIVGWIFLSGRDFMFFNTPSECLMLQASAWWMIHWCDIQQLQLVIV